jgi:hypothetical protein
MVLDRKGVNESVARSAMFNGDALTSVITPPPCGGGVGGEGAIVAHEFVKSLRKHMARAVSLLCWHLRGHGCPLSPNPSPARGEGSISVPPNTFIHTRIGSHSEYDQMMD